MSPRKFVRRRKKSEYITEPCDTAPNKAHHWILPSYGIAITGKCKYCDRERTFNANMDTPSDVSWINSDGVHPGVERMKRLAKQKSENQSLGGNE